MDPRHPEQAVSRIRELMNQFDDLMSEIKVTPVSNRLGELERQGSLVVQEICLVAPRLHEAMMQASRTRRFTLSHSPVMPVENFEEPVAEPEIVGGSCTIVGIDEFTTQEAKVVEEKPKKKKTSKKKAE